MHAPPGYRCPFCRNARDGTADHTLEIVHRDDVWHYHLHVIPRWHGDALDTTEPTLAPPDEVRRRASMLRAAWQEAGA